MPTLAQKPATTPIPVQLSASEFQQFILPHLSLPKRGPQCKLGYYRVFNLILWVLYTGMQWKCLPVGLDHRIGHFALVRPQKNEQPTPIEVETRGRPRHPSPSS
jgi:hypothetical protein